jgi:hypothetical protein
MIFILIEILETNEKYTFNSTDFCEKRLLPNGGPRLVASATSGFDSSSIFFIDGWKGGAGTGVYHSGGQFSS